MADDVNPNESGVSKFSDAAGFSGGGGPPGPHSPDEKEEDGATMRGAGGAGTRRRRTWLRRAYDRAALGIVTKDMFGMKEDDDTYLRIVPNGPRDRAGRRTISDAQLRKALLVMILEKGYTQIYCYRGSQIDSDLANRARIMIALMSRPYDDEHPEKGGYALFEHAEELRKQGKQLSSQLFVMDEPEPFLKIPLVRDLSHKWRQVTADISWKWTLKKNDWKEKMSGWGSRPDL